MCFNANFLKPQRAFMIDNIGVEIEMERDRIAHQRVGGPWACRQRAVSELVEGGP